MKFRTKIILIVISLSVIVNTLILVFFIINSRETSMGLLHNKILTNSQLLNQVNAGPLYDGDILKLNTNLKSFLADPEIVSIHLKELHGNINFSFDARAGGNERVLSNETTITYNGEEVGVVTTMYTTKLIDDRLADSIRFVLFSYLIVGLSLSLALYLLLKRITQPIQELTDLSTEIANGNLDKDIRISGKDEIGILSQSLVLMRNSIKDTIHSLEIENQERRVAEKKLQVAKNYIDNIINSMPSLLVGVDHEHRVTQWNKKAEEFSGISYGEAKGRRIESVLPHFTNNKEKIDQAILSKQVLQENGCEVHYKEQTRYEDITVFPLVDTHTSGAVIQIDDVTEQHEIRNELAHSRKLDAIGQLAGGIAHDFNNMLAGILGAAELMGAHLEDDPKVQAYLNLIIQSGQRAGDLTKKLLIFSRKGKVELAPISVTKAVQEAVSILKHSIDKRVSISLSINTEHSFIIGDISQLQNALINLGVNGGLAMPEGGKLSFTLDQVDLSKEYCEGHPFDIRAGQYLYIKVADTGIGIPPENIHNIFEPFYTTRQQGDGSGLGLAAVYGTIQLHNGAITVDSEEGKGTTFHIYLPLADQQGDEKKLSEGLPVRGSGRVLVVDDEEVIRLTAAGILERLGYEVLLANDGKSGLEIFSKEHTTIDVVIMDMIMPKMNGRECFFNMKEIQPGVRVIMASGFSRDADLKELKKAGLKGVLRKPYTMTQLSKAIAIAVGDVS